MSRARDRDAPRAYEVGGFRDPEAELARLRAQAQGFLAQELPHLDALGLPADGTVLDVGTGPGFVAAGLEALRPGLRVVGVDADARWLDRRRPVVVGDATRLPFASGRFDAAYARLVLRHLPDPGAACREMARVVRPGGVVLVGDTDDGTLVLEPEPAGFGEVLAARHEGFRRRGADPCIGRRLPRLLVEAGLADVSARVLPVSTAALPAAAFASVVLAPIADAIDPDLVPRERVAEVARGLETWARTPGAFGSTTAVFAGGRRGEAAPRG